MWLCLALAPRYKNQCPLSLCLSVCLLVDNVRFLACTLVVHARVSPGSVVSAAAATARPSPFPTRFKSILDASAPRRGLQVSSEDIKIVKKPRGRDQWRFFIVRVLPDGWTAGSSGLGHRRTTQHTDRRRRTDTVVASSKLPVLLLNSSEGALTHSSRLFEWRE